MRTGLAPSILALCLAACGTESSPLPQENKESKGGTELAVKARKHADANELCSAMCEKTAGLPCSLAREECLSQCNDMASGDECHQQVQAFLECALAQPLERFHCDEGPPSIQEGSCDSEQALIAACAGLF